jgi:hypothetical protein
MSRRAAWVLLVLVSQLAAFLGPRGAFGDSYPFLWEGLADWEHGALILDTRTPVEPGEVYPDLRYRTQRRIEEELPDLIVEAVLGLNLDSFDSVGDRIKQDEVQVSPGAPWVAFQGLKDAAADGFVEESASFSRNLREVHIRYRVPFFGPDGLASTFVRHRRPLPMRSVLGFVPSRPFDGLVIYAQGELPAHGKDTRERVQPAFFPRLFDQDLNLVLSAEMCQPEALKRWGVAAYSYSGERAVDLERVGAFPLRTVARGVFGKNSTDLLLSDEAVRQLLALEANRRMLQEGRVLIVIDPPAPR